MQGCPMPGSVFALGFDPILRVLRPGLPRPASLRGAFADNVASASRDIYAALPVFMRVMMLAGCSAGLVPNLKRTVMLLHGEFDREEEERKFRERGVQ
eukprot:184200-Pyramimonas_sp.AAC.1